MELCSILNSLLFIYPLIQQYLYQKAFQVFEIHQEIKEAISLSSESMILFIEVRYINIQKISATNIL